MHKSILSFVSGKIKDGKIRVLDFGSRNINGTPRDILPQADYYGLDTEKLNGVNEVIRFGEKLMFNDNYFDAILYLDTSQVDTHTTFHIEEFRRVLKPDGVLIFTARSKTFPEDFMGRKVKRFDDTEIKELLKDFSDVEIIKDPELAGWLAYAVNKKESESETTEEKEDDDGFQKRKYHKRK